VVFRCFNPAGARLEDLELPLPVELRRASEIRAAVVRGARPFKNGSLVRLDGIATRDAATAVTGYHLCVPRTALPPLAEDECYTEDLIGCAVFDLAGKARGRVASVFWNGSHDVLVVLDERGDELLVPVVGDFLASIDLSQSLIVVDPHE
jgi:16S rRNA processing protein RimM